MTSEKVHEGRFNINQKIPHPAIAGFGIPNASEGSSESITRFYYDLLCRPESRATGKRDLLNLVSVFPEVA